jgi:antitoxin component YwqK of YwqJK toxin-antitoxin module
LNGKDSKPGRYDWCRSKDGRRVQYVEFQPDGKEKRQICDFRDGQPDGPFTAWYPGGKAWIAGQFSAGHPDGRWSQWDKAGSRVAEGEYRAGRFVAGAPVAGTVACSKLRPPKS